MSAFTGHALRNYETHNKKLPSTIVVYRDGVGGPSMQKLVLEVELGRMIQAFKSYRQGYEPKILYVFVNKEINTRLFEPVGENMLNPPEGTVVDTDLVEIEGSADKFDFYMIPHHASIATARPVHYIVAKNDTGLSKRQVEQFTYDQCYQYFNFGGSIKVPASVMYAHKIAKYCHDVRMNALPDKLEKNLHFL